MEGVLKALKKIHDGASLTFMDEASLQALFHEIQHTRQITAGINVEKFLDTPEAALMEAVNDWTARRNYHEFLRKLGRRSTIAGDRIKREAFGRSELVDNFDTLLKRLDITDNEILDRLTTINNSVPVNSFNKPVSELLEEIAEGKPVRPLDFGVDVFLRLLNLDKKDFEEFILQ